MRTDWRKSTWGEEVSLEYGKAIRDYNQSGGKYRVFGSNGPIGWTSQYLAKGPGVILGRKGAYRGVEFSSDPFFVIDTAYYLAPKTELDMRWLYYAVKHHRLGEIDDGSPIPSTTRAAVYVRDLEVPPFNEQRSIAAVLSAFDDKIELDRRMNETLEAMARAIFKSWFVDFDPVRAKSEGRKPAGMDEATAALFPNAFQPSPLGPIPRGWQVSRIGEEVTVVGGSTPRTDEPSFWGGSHAFATPKDLAGLASPVLLDTERQITAAGVEQISSGILPKGTVLLSSRAPIGYLAIAELSVSVNQGFIAMVCNKRLPNHYVLNWATENMPSIEANANGTTFLEVSKANFRPIQVLVPEAKVLERFTATVQPLYELVVSNLRESRTLATTRDTLLPKLLSGELSVTPKDD